MRYRFDEFTLDTDSFELSRRSVAIDVEPQVVELLALLVENNHRMVTKEEINREVWKGRVVSDAALSSRIKSLRRALGDSGRDQRFIRTVHKKGFRFVAGVTRADDDPDAAAATGAARDDAASVPKDAAPAHDSSALTRPSVAVLPFKNLSSEPGQEYFADGITTDIITHLAKHRWLAVTARNTSFGYKDSDAGSRVIGRELDVDYLVEGNVQRAADRVRISAYLVDARTGYHKWSERFDRRLSDIFALQDEITEKIVARVEPEIGYAERNKVLSSRPPNLKAWDLYHLGIYHFFQFTGEDNREAQHLLQQSRELDERFGEAYAWWAYAVILGMVYWDTPPTEGLLDKALAACEKAVSLDSQNAVFHALKARVLLARREYDRAIAENETAIELNPTLAAAHCGLGDSLAYEGRYQESLGCFEKSIELSPNDPQRWAFFTYGALALLFKGDFAKALEWLERASSLPNCQYWTSAHKVVALIRMNRHQEARVAVGQLLRENPDFCRDFVRKKLFYLKDPEQIDLYIDALEEAGVPESRTEPGSRGTAV